MTFEIECWLCGCSLPSQGALLFAPPSAISTCRKDHLCRECYDIVKAFILREKAKRMRLMNRI